MTDIVERAKRALEGVTPGPWKWEQSKHLRGWYIITSRKTTAVHATEWSVVGESEFDRPDAKFCAAARTLVPELVAEVERLHSWDGLMSLLDEHYPESIFPTEEDHEGRDPGPRIISLLRRINEIRSQS